MTADFGHLRSGERRAWIGLGGILIIIAFIHSLFTPSRTPSDWENIRLMISDTLDQMAVNKRQSEAVHGNPSRNWNKNTHVNNHSNYYSSLHAFDPNSVTEEEMFNMGFPPSLIKSIKGYRNKIGPFKSEADFESLYAHTEYSKNKLRPFLKIPKSKTIPSNDGIHEQNRASNKQIQVNLNTADSSELIKVKGIGPYYAKQILRYRERLGGFIHMSQLREIRNLPDSVYQKITPQLTIDPSEIRLIYINKADELTLNGHPYIGRRDARAIIAYRNQHGAYQNSNALRKILSLDSSVIGRIIPYLDYSE